MEEKLNIAEILKDTPTGTLLYSPIFGELAYIGSYANEGQTYSIIICQYPDAIGQGDSVSVEFDENGTYLNHGYSSRRGGECMLFPSKNNRDWSTFKCPWRYKHFEPFQKVLIVNKHSFEQAIWVVSLYSFYRDGIHYTLSGVAFSDNDILPYKGNENKLGKPVK